MNPKNPLELSVSYFNDIVHLDAKIRDMQRQIRMAFPNASEADIKQDFASMGKYALLVIRQGGMTQLAAMHSIVSYARHGVQVRVTKEVSHDLIHSDLKDPRVEHLEAIPSKSMEIYSEDPNIPTILFQIGCRAELVDDLNWAFPDIDWEREITSSPDIPDDYRYVRLLLEGEPDPGIETEGTQVMSSTMPFEEYETAIRDVRALEKNSAYEREPVHDLSTQLTDNQHDDLTKIVQYAHKVILYAQTPWKEEDVPPKSITRKQGGKPGFKGRPKRPITRLIDLPVVERRKHDQAAREKGAGKKAFNGRRGHFRVLTHKRWVNKRGQTIYVPPTPGPDGSVPRVYKVRKPKQKTSCQDS